MRSQGKLVSQGCATARLFEGEDPRMKLRTGFACMLAAAATIGAAVAADGDQFLIRGDATKAMLEQNMLNVGTAEKVAQACVAEAVKQGVRVAVAVLDQFSEPIY